jgi:hypothetical protein
LVQTGVSWEGEGAFRFLANYHLLGIRGAPAVHPSKPMTKMLCPVLSSLICPYSGEKWVEEERVPASYGQCQPESPL